MALGVRKECPNRKNGCPSFLNDQEEYELHLTVCSFASIDCPNKCTLKVFKGNLVVHLTRECPKRPGTCKYCRNRLLQELVEEHQLKCDQRRLVCEYCRKFGFLKRELAAHHEHCGQKPRTCQFKTLGCTFEAPSVELMDHEVNIYEHFELMFEGMLKLEAEFKKIRLNLEALQREVDECKIKQKNLNEMQRFHNKELQAMRMHLWSKSLKSVKANRAARKQPKSTAHSTAHSTVHTHGPAQTCSTAENVASNVASKDLLSPPMSFHSTEDLSKDKNFLLYRFLRGSD